LIYLINRYYDPATGQFVSVDPMVNETNQPYAYAGDDPVNGVDPMGLCNTPGAIGFYPGVCATTGAEAIAAGQYIESHAGGGGFSFTNGFKAVADYGAGIANFAVSTATLGHFHISDPYCGFSWASDVGYGFGAVSTGILTLGEADVAIGASDAAEGGAAFTDDTVLVRGGENTAERLTNGTKVVTDTQGNLQGVSFNSGSSIEEASQGIPHNQIEVTTVGDIQAAGGTVESAPEVGNPGHCLVGGLSANVLSSLLTPTIKNPRC
jgi:hypothetical protein